MRALKLVGIVLGGLFAVIVILLLAARLFVNPNDYKGRIEKAVKDATGRELAMSGEIKLSVFPWLALALGPASIGNPPGFSVEPFAAVQHVSLRVKLLPLLRGQLHIGRIEIDGLDLRLHKNAEGKGNWEDFGARNAASASPASGSETLRDLAGIVIKDSRVSYQDIVADHLNIDVGHVASGAAVPVKLKLSLATSRAAPPIEIASQFELMLDMAKKQYRFASLELSGTTASKSGAATVPWKFSVPDLSVDLAAQTLSANTFTAQLAGAHLTGNARGSKIVDAPSLVGAFKLEPTSLRELMGQLGIASPPTRDAKALGKLAASGEFFYGGNAVGATKLDVQLDDSALLGKAAITNLDTKAMSFDLVLDHIDVDRYRSPNKTSPRSTDTAAELPTDTLKALQMEGKFAIGSARISGVSLSQLTVRLMAKDGVTRIAPATAKLYGGDYAGQITLDDRGATPAMKLDQSMTGIDVAPLLMDFTKSKRISGHGNVTTNLAANGRGSDALMKSLSGHVTANLDNGAVEGMDLWFEINRAIALIQGQTVPAGQSSGRTKFDTFKASAEVNNGIASTKDLNIASQNLRVTGQGTTNLVTEAIDYQLNVTILKEAPTGKSATGPALANVPLTVTGTMTNPTVRPDVQGMAKARVQQELDKHKDELQQKVQEQLKGLFK